MRISIKITLAAIAYGFTFILTMLMKGNLSSLINSHVAYEYPRVRFCCDEGEYFENKKIFCDDSSTINGSAINASWTTGALFSIHKGRPYGILYDSQDDNETANFKLLKVSDIYFV